MKKISLFILLATTFYTSFILTKAKGASMEQLHPNCALIQPTVAIPLGLYRHYKGYYYQVIALGHNEATLEDVVIYKSLGEDARWWVRPLAVFCETITLDKGQQVQRFTHIEQQP